MSEAESSGTDVSEIERKVSEAQPRKLVSSRSTHDVIHSQADEEDGAGYPEFVAAKKVGE